MKTLSVETLRVRRPTAPSAEPGAGPGGLDYVSHPLPNESLDCEKVESLFQGMALAPLKDCLDSLKQAGQVTYRLHRTAQPELVLQTPDESPPCLKKALPKIPVPREIFYRSVVSGEAGGCFATGLNLKEDEWMGSKVPFYRYDLVLTLPLNEPLKDVADLRRQLIAWAITPFYDKRVGGLRAIPLPEQLCRTCLDLSHEEFRKSRGKPLRVWP